MSLPSKGIPEKGITAYGAKVHNRQEKIMSRLKDAVSAARSYKVTSDRLWEMIQEAINSERPLPPYEAGYVNGYAWALRDQVWNRDLRWQLYLDGVKVTTDEISKVADREETPELGRSATWGRVLGRMEWIEGGKPFTELGKA